MTGMTGRHHLQNSYDFYGDTYQPWIVRRCQLKTLKSWMAEKILIAIGNLGTYIALYVLQFHSHSIAFQTFIFDCGFQFLPFFAPLFDFWIILFFLNCHVLDYEFERFCITQGICIQTGQIFSFRSIVNISGSWLK